MKYLFIILLLSFSSLYSQNHRKGIEYTYDLSKIESADTVTWFGWDYSHLIINDHKLNLQDLKTKWIPYWYDSVEDDGFGSKRIKKQFSGKVFLHDPRTIQSLVSAVPETKLVDIYRAPINIDSVKYIVKNYKVSGGDIGVVSIVSEMRKRDISVIIFTVIFDMRTKEVLYCVQANGKAGDKGSLGRFYNKGLVLAMKVFTKKF